MDRAAVGKDAADHISLQLHASDDRIERNLHAVFHGVFRQRDRQLIRG